MVSEILSLDSKIYQWSEKDQEHYLLQTALVKKEIHKLTKWASFTLYQSYRSDYENKAISSVEGGGGVLASQGGVEALFRVPKIGFRDERTLDIVSRIFWNTEPKSLEIDEDSIQVGLGLKYKPLKTHNFYVSAEQLFEVGDKTKNDTLLRTMYSWADGLELKEGEQYWNMTSVYADVGYFIDEPSTWAAYGEVRQGVTCNINDKWLVTPHVMLARRWQDPDPQDSTGTEMGAGVSMKHTLGNFDESENPIGTAEYSVQYRKAIEGEADDGWVVSVLFQF